MGDFSAEVSVYLNTVNCEKDLNKKQNALSLSLLYPYQYINYYA
jgi:hypothetical protein